MLIIVKVFSCSRLGLYVHRGFVRSSSTDMNIHYGRFSTAFSVFNENCLHLRCRTSLLVLFKIWGSMPFYRCHSRGFLSWGSGSATGSTTRRSSWWTIKSRSLSLFSLRTSWTIAYCTKLLPHIYIFVKSWWSTAPWRQSSFPNSFSSLTTCYTVSFALDFICLGMWKCHRFIINQMLTVIIKSVIPSFLFPMKLFIYFSTRNLFGRYCISLINIGTWSNCITASFNICFVGK